MCILAIDWYTSTSGKRLTRRTADGWVLRGACFQAAILADSVNVCGIFLLSVLLQEHGRPFSLATLWAFQKFLACGVGADKVGEH